MRSHTTSFYNCIKPARFLVFAGASLFAALTSGQALASTGCDTANAGGYDVTTGIGGTSIINFNGAFDAGDTLHFATDANNLAVSIVNLDSGLTAIAGTGVLSTDFALTATQTYTFTGTLTAVVLNTTTLTVTCTATSGGGGGSGGSGDSGDDTQSKTNTTNTLISALVGRPSLFGGGVAGTEADAFSRHCKFLRRRMAKLEDRVARASEYSTPPAELTAIQRRIERLRREIDPAAGGQCATTAENVAPPQVAAELKASGSLGVLPGTGGPVASGPLPVSRFYRPVPDAFLGSAGAATRFSSETPGGVEGKSLSQSFSASRKVGESIIVGAFTQFRHGTAELAANSADANANFGGVGTTMIAMLTDNLTFRAASLFEWGDGSVEISGDSGSFSIQTMQLGARLEGTIPFGNWTLTPAVSSEFADTVRDGFTDSSGTSVASENFQSAKLVFGPELQRSFLFSRPGGIITLHPFARVQGSWEYLDDDEVSSNPDRTLVTQGEIAMRYGGGFRLVWSDDFALSASADTTQFKESSDLQLATQLAIPLRRRGGNQYGSFNLNANAVPGGGYYAGFRANVKLN
jgi:hypothetical protein